MDMNYSLLGKILKRYLSSTEEKVEIFLTSPGYQKGIGDHNCWVISDGLQVPKLMKEGLFELLESPIKHPSSPQNLPEVYSVKIYHGNIFLQKTRDWYENEALKQKTNPDWSWHNREKGEYKFGKRIFKVGGKRRKKIFQGLMDLYGKSHSALSVSSLCEMGNINAKILRIEINAINQRLRKQLTLTFKGSRRGYYTLEKYFVKTKT